MHSAFEPLHTSVHPASNTHKLNVSAGTRHNFSEQSDCLSIIAAQLKSPWHQISVLSVLHAHDSWETNCLSKPGRRTHLQLSTLLLYGCLYVRTNLRKALSCSYALGEAKFQTTLVEVDVAPGV